MTSLEANWRLTVDGQETGRYDTYAEALKHAPGTFERRWTIDKEIDGRHINCMSVWTKRASSDELSIASVAL